MECLKNQANAIIAAVFHTMCTDTQNKHERIAQQIPDQTAFFISLFKLTIRLPVNEKKKPTTKILVCYIVADCSAVPL